MIAYVLRAIVRAFYLDFQLFTAHPAALLWAAVVLASLALILAIVPTIRKA